MTSYAADVAAAWFAALFTLSLMIAVPRMVARLVTRGWF